MKRILILSLLCLSSILQTPLVAENPVVIVEIEIQKEDAPVTGSILIELFEDEAPITVGNFMSYVNNRFYDNTIFHRVIDRFMIQGGGYDKNQIRKPTYPPIKNEADNNISNLKGTIAMARTQIVNSATSQFFINVNNNTFLDHRNTTDENYGYAVFGKVIEGMDFMLQVARLPTVKTGQFQNMPNYPVVIKSVRLSKRRGSSNHSKQKAKKNKSPNYYL